MDRPDADPAELRRALHFIRRVNRWLGYTRATLRQIERFSREWDRQTTYTLLDVATGSADVPAAIMRWARRRGWKVRVIGIDFHAGTIAAAAGAIAADSTATEPADGSAVRGDQAQGDIRQGGITLLRGDALRLPLADASVDYAMTSMFLHHLTDADVTRALAELGRVARRGVVVSDLLRNRRAYAWISLFTCLTSEMVRHDARTSVRQAFTPAEICQLRDAAGLGQLTYRRHFGHRFTLAGEHRGRD